MSGSISTLPCSSFNRGHYPQASADIVCVQVGCAIERKAKMLRSALSPGADYSLLGVASCKLCAEDKEIFTLFVLGMPCPSCGPC